MERERLVLTPDEEDRILVKDGKKYRLLKQKIEGGHIKEVIFEQFNQDELDAKIKKIADYLITSSGMDAKMILQDVLKQMDTSTIDKIAKQVKREESVEIEHGCLGIKIGKRKIEIV